MNLKERVSALEKAVGELKEKNQMYSTLDMPSPPEYRGWYPPVSLRTVVERLLDHLGLAVHTTPHAVHLKRIQKKEDKK